MLALKTTPPRASIFHTFWVIPFSLSLVFLDFQRKINRCAMRLPREWRGGMEAELDNVHINNYRPSTHSLYYIRAPILDQHQCA